jgi:hypothetical protein
MRIRIRKRIQKMSKNNDFISNLRKEIDEAREALAAAHDEFRWAAPHFVETACANVKLAEERYSALLRQYKEAIK